MNTKTNPTINNFFLDPSFTISASRNDKTKNAHGLNPSMRAIINVKIGSGNEIPSSSKNFKGAVSTDFLTRTKSEIMKMINIANIKSLL